LPREINHLTILPRRPEGRRAPPKSTKRMGGNMSRPRAADDFATIRARLEELRRGDQRRRPPRASCNRTYRCVPPNMHTGRSERSALRQDRSDNLAQYAVRSTEGLLTLASATRAAPRPSLGDKPLHSRHRGADKRAGCFRGRFPPVSLGDVFGAAGDHAAGRQFEQAETGLTARPYCGQFSNIRAVL
jgi:hypothetical protein